MHTITSLNCFEKARHGGDIWQDQIANRRPPRFRSSRSAQGVAASGLHASSMKSGEIREIDEKNTIVHIIAGARFGGDAAGAAEFRRFHLRIGDRPKWPSGAWRQD